MGLGMALTRTSRESACVWPSGPLTRPLAQTPSEQQLTFPARAPHGLGAWPGLRLNSNHWPLKGSGKTLQWFWHPAHGFKAPQAGAADGAFADLRAHAQLAPRQGRLFANAEPFAQQKPHRFQRVRSTIPGAWEWTTFAIEVIESPIPSGDQGPAQGPRTDRCAIRYRQASPSAAAAGCGSTAADRWLGAHAETGHPLALAGLFLPGALGHGGRLLLLALVDNPRISQGGRVG